MIGALVNLIIYLLVLGILYWILMYIVDNVIPEPPARIIKVVGVVIIALVAVMLLLSLIGVGGINMPRLNIQ
jgi:hypothetical protein